MLGLIGIGAGQQHGPFGALAEGGPDLLSVDDPLVAIAHRGGGQRGHIGTSPGLGEQLAPTLLAGHQRRQQMALGFVAGPLLDGGCGQRQARTTGHMGNFPQVQQRERPGGIRARQTTAAMVDGVVGCDPSGPPEDAHDLASVDGVAQTSQGLLIAATGGVDPGRRQDRGEQ